MCVYVVYGWEFLTLNHLLFFVHLYVIVTFVHGDVPIHGSRFLWTSLLVGRVEASRLFGRVEAYRLFRRTFSIDVLVSRRPVR